MKNILSVIKALVSSGNRLLQSLVLGTERSYRKGQVLFHEIHGISVVEDVVSRVLPSCEVARYYRLRSLGDKKIISYVPVERQQLYLRELTGSESKENIKLLDGLYGSF